jgi:hypothetical protein
VPLLDGPIILDVTLQRDGEVRRWTISKWSMGWTCKYVEKGTVIVGGCLTFELMQAKKRQWEADIAALRADGWT